MSILFAFNQKRPTMLYEDVKVTCKVMCTKILFVDLGVSKSFILAPYTYNLTMMMESFFSFLLSYLSIVFLAKSNISKSVSFFLSYSEPKRCWPLISLQDFKSNISLEQSDEIVYFFTC